MLAMGHFTVRLASLLIASRIHPPNHVENFSQVQSSHGQSVCRQTGARSDLFKRAESDIWGLLEACDSHRYFDLLIPVGMFRGFLQYKI